MAGQCPFVGSDNHPPPVDDAGIGHPAQGCLAKTSEADARILRALASAKPEQFIASAFQELAS